MSASGVDTKDQSWIDNIGNWCKSYLLPLYGRKMIIAIFASVMYFLGIHWEAVEDGYTAVLESNKYFTDGGMWFYGILFIFMGGQLVDKLTLKRDDFQRAREFSVWQFLKTKTKEIFEPRPFLVWLMIAIAFAWGAVTDEMLFYFSAGYVGVNSAEALTNHIRAVREGARIQLSELRDDINQPSERP